MIRKTAFLVFLGLAAAFGYFYYVEYFQWRGCFNEQGRCFDETSGVVYSEQSGTTWFLLFVGALGAGLYQAWRLRNPKR